MNHTVLIVDDADFMRMMLRDIVEEMGMKVIGEATNGAEAVEQFGALNPELVLLDITMPVMDGLEAVKQIMAANAEAAVVMITALGQKDQVLACIKAGALDFIIKPFDQERVTETLGRLLAPQPV
ncbi:two-component system response regulator [bacterium DOLJORAL78_65_58]|nr:MAG: two-component system response regulator [bacterium DOLZORAL124_64_63]PIE75922.1 MAG: two-component system response regulator [bacterium DOLJORAL78_65_58]